jgi:hypothetical protein
METVFQDQTHLKTSFTASFIGSGINGNFILFQSLAEWIPYIPLPL